METKWYKDALFAGMTANAFKLGSVLTSGWFWSRISGCSVLYRGGSMETIDFTNVLAVTELGAETISPPDYVAHENSTTYFYVVRRVNNCGEQEHTLTAAVKVVIDANGDLAAAQPNSIFMTRAEQIADRKVKLLWYYSPIEQKSTPAYFKIYYDNKTGQVDYENEIATVSYVGRRFYSYQSGTLEAGRYLFAIRVQDSDGIKDSSLTKLSISIETESPETIEILSTEAI